MTEKKEKKKGWLHRRQEKQMRKAGGLLGTFLKGIKEELKEEKVIVKIRCQSCNNLFDETLDNCPHCGVKR